MKHLHEKCHNKLVLVANPHNKQILFCPDVLHASFEMRLNNSDHIQILPKYDQWQQHECHTF